MPIDFPSNPSSGQTYSYAGQQWQFNGVAWDKIITADVANDANALYGISGSIYASNLATGLLYGGIISINAGNSAHFDITAGRGQIHASGSTYTSGPFPTFQYVNWPGQTGITLTYLATSDTTWIYVDSAGIIQQRPTYYTDEQLEETIIIGQLVHPSRTFINLARTNPNVAYATDKQYEQFIRSFGPIKVSGHTISPNGANLKLNRTSGTAFSLGRNWINDTDNPSVVSDPAQTDCTFFRYYRGVTAGSFITVPGMTLIDPTKYDNGTGTLATVPGGKYTIQRLFYYPNTPTLLGVYYGRAEYTSLADAAANINFENFTEIENTRTNAIFAGYLLVRSGTTNLSNTSDALILQAGSFRSTTSGGGSVSLTLDDLTDVIITSPQNYQVLTYVDGVTGWENLSVTSLPLVSSFNGLTGAVTGVTTGTANTFVALQSFNAGISASGGTFNSDINVNGLRIGRGTSNISTNIAIGITAYNSGVTGFNNIAIGGSALRDNSTGDGNVGIGEGALRANTRGRVNTAIGTSALLNLNSATAGVGLAEYNIAIGASALQNSTTASYNMAIGTSSLSANTTGIENVAIGTFALIRNNTGNDNIAIGHQALGPGFGSANALTENISIGWNSLFNTNTTSRNTAIGAEVGFRNTTGALNTLIGRRALYNNATGSNNTAIGAQAGEFAGTAGATLQSSTNSVLIGYLAASGNTTSSNEIVIGANAVGLGSNTAVIGATTQTSATIYGLLNASSGVSASGGTFSGNIQAATFTETSNSIRVTNNARSWFL